MKKKKKGAIIDIIVFVSMAFLVTVVLAVWLHGWGEITDTLSLINNSIGTEGDTIGSVSDDVFGQADTGMSNTFPWIAFALMFGMIITIFVSNFLVKVHPVFFFVYLAILILAVVLSVNVSNAYEDLLTNAIMGDELTSFGASTFFLLNLPLVTTVVGFIGMIILFVGFTRDKELGGIG